MEKGGQRNIQYFLFEDKAVCYSMFKKFDSFIAQKISYTKTVVSIFISWARGKVAIMDLEVT